MVQWLRLYTPTGSILGQGTKILCASRHDQKKKKRGKKFFFNPHTVQFSGFQYLPNPGIEPRSPLLQADALPVEPPGKPKNTGVGSLSLVQQIFPTQESNPGLLYCRWILYQLSYQGSCQYIHTVVQPSPPSNFRNSL